MHTSANIKLTHSKSPGLRGFFAMAVVCLWIILVLDGCMTASPRFRSSAGASVEKKADVRGNPDRRFGSKEAEEEVKEDDKRPSPKVLESVASGTRSFRAEKNTSIQPMAHSRMMREISKYMGVPYLLGGEDMNGMDCSGYTKIVYQKSMNRALPRTSSEQSRTGIPVRRDQLQFGDLVFFNTTGEPASHVGIYLGDDLFAHASVSLGVTISSLQSTYFNKRFEAAKRIIR